MSSHIFLSKEHWSIVTFNYVTIFRLIICVYVSFICVFFWQKAKNIFLYFLLEGKKLQWINLKMALRMWYRSHTESWFASVRHNTTSGTPDVSSRVKFFLYFQIVTPFHRSIYFQMTQTEIKLWISPLINTLTL